MKKFNFLLKTILCSLLLSFSLISCGVKSTAVNGIYTSSTEATEVAKKKGLPVVVIATMEGSDFYSSDLKTAILNDTRMESEIANDFVVLHLDFSEAAYQATVFNDESTDSEREEAERKAKIMQENTLLASRLNLQETPAIYILSKDLYFISMLDYLTDEVTNYDSFKAMIYKQTEDIEVFNAKVDATKTGSKEEKLEAIDRLYEDTDIVYRAFLTDLINEYISLDKDNSTGLLSKYIIAKADIESSNYFMAGDIRNAVKVYVDCAKDARIEPEHRQNLYYLASYLLVATNSTDFEAIRSYLQSAIDAYPEGPNVPQLEMILTQFNQMVAPLEEEAPTEE